MYQKTVLDNGLRILTSPMPHTRSVSVGFFVSVGSRYEDREENGITHFTLSSPLLIGRHGRARFTASTISF